MGTIVDTSKKFDIYVDLRWFILHYELS